MGHPGVSGLSGSHIRQRMADVGHPASYCIRQRMADVGQQTKTFRGCKLTEGN
jgi:hypothetical protein